nr:helix-turn-helix domain-containing protein [Nonomuraea diastatica]
MPGHHPTRSRRTTARKGDVRERAILDTCEALLAHKGYDAMSVGDIAQGAGITRGALQGAALITRSRTGTSTSWASSGASISLIVAGSRRIDGRRVLQRR